MSVSNIARKCRLGCAPPDVRRDSDRPTKNGGEIQAILGPDLTDDEALCSTLSSPAKFALAAGVSKNKAPDVRGVPGRSVKVR